MSELSSEQRDNLPGRKFAFPKQRKEPIEDAGHVRSAIGRFNQVDGVTDEERDEAWQRIKDAAQRYDVDVNVDDWRDLGTH